MRTNSFIPLSRPTINQEEINEVIDSLKSGWITTGPKVAKFEHQLCQYFNVEQCLTVNSGTAAWQVLAHSYDIGPGDEVIIPSITWPSMANVVELLGAKPVFADVDPDTAILLTEEVDRLITPKTKAILPVHYAGAAADIDSYRDIIGNRNILIAEDCAHALGTMHKGQLIGSHSDAAIFSFHPTKNITTGEGGALICKDQDRLNRARTLSLNGIGKTAWERINQKGAHYELHEPGYKFNMLDIQAALGIHQLAKIQDFISKRTHLAERYHEKLTNIDYITPLKADNKDQIHAWHIYPVKIDIEQIGLTRNQVIDALKKQNVGVGVHFESVHLLRFYREKYQYTEKDLPNATKLGSSLISLPLFPTMTSDEQDTVINALKNIAE